MIHMWAHKWNMFTKSVPNIQNYVNEIMPNPKTALFLSIPVPLSEMFTILWVYSYSERTANSLQSLKIQSRTLIGFWYLKMIYDLKRFYFIFHPIHLVKLFYQNVISSHWKNNHWRCSCCSREPQTVEFGKHTVWTVVSEIWRKWESSGINWKPLIWQRYRKREKQMENEKCIHNEYEQNVNVNKRRNGIGENWFQFTFSLQINFSCASAKVPEMNFEHLLLSQLN